MRELKALEIAARSRITHADGVWSVPSQTCSTATYRVTLGESPSCDCEDWSLRQQGTHVDPTAKPCKHILAARLTCERDHGGKSPGIIAESVPKRPTYKQN